MAQPSHLLVTQDETVWMSDPTLNRRPQYNLNGMLLTYRGAAGSFAGAVSNPHHIDEDPDGNVAVADYANDRLQKIVPTAGGDPRRLIQPAFASMHGAAR